MTLKDCVDSTSWKQVKTEILAVYPNAEEPLLGYQVVYERLRAMSPSPITSDNRNLSIHIQWETVPGEESYWGVWGIRPNEPDKYGLEFMAWSDWLQLPLIPPEEMSPAKIVALCLYEMTWYGYDEEHIAKTMQKLSEIAEEHGFLPPF